MFVGELIRIDRTEIRSDGAFAFVTIVQLSIVGIGNRLLFGQFLVDVIAQRWSTTDDRICVT